MPSEDWEKDIREGELTVELPSRHDASLYFIGRVRTPWKRREDCPKNIREIDVQCRLEIDPRWAAGLKDLDQVSHLIVLYWMDRARRDLVVQAPRHYASRHGTFAIRSPARPNPIALAVVRLFKIEGATLTVGALDCLDNTPLLDIKPYFASVDSVPEAIVGWQAGTAGKSGSS